VAITTANSWIFDSNRLKSINLETIPARPTCFGVFQRQRARSGNLMQNQITDSEEHIDRTTTASICNAIGERLRQNLRPESTALPSRLQALLDEMRHQDRQSAAEA
jgi:hypothetical protein